MNPFGQIIRTGAQISFGIIVAVFFAFLLGLGAFALLLGILWGQWL